MTGRIARAVAPALAAVLLLAGALAAQAPALRGRIVDPQGRGLAGLPVVLHQVTEAGGAEVARDSSDADGRFALPLERAAGEGVYFAATRWEGSLYVGAPFRSATELAGEYAIVVGQNAVGGAAGVQAPPAPPDGGVASWPVVLLLAVVAGAAVAVPVVRSRRGPLAVRTLLVELAEVEERLDSNGAPVAPGTRRALEAERDALRDRVRALTRPAVADAADHD